MANTFNLKESQEAFPPMDPMGINETPELMEPQNNILQFKDGADLKVWLDPQEPINARTELLAYVAGEEGEETVDKLLEEYYGGNFDSNGRVKIAALIFEQLPDTIKQIEEGEGEIMAPYVRANNEVEEIIKKMAKKAVKNKKVKSFNIKTAQHQSVDNMIMYGPGQTQIDPFYRMPVSDWHIVERNKGWGQDIGGIWNIDYETIWRENIMDKYSRPYKDKEGNWVGGYIQKRFEVDKNIPEETNMQLKPGQRRKPRLPQYGLTEARLQDARSKGEITGGPVVDKTKPFNWSNLKWAGTSNIKEAQSKKKR